MNVFDTGFGAFGTVAVLFGLVQVILWLVIAWRAMRAHEDIAGSLEELTRHIRRRDDENSARRQEPLS